VVVNFPHIFEIRLKRPLAEIFIIIREACNFHTKKLKFIEMGKKTGTFVVGQLVYAKVKGYSSWPAKVSAKHLVKHSKNDLLKIHP
jgi:hypothetical protein